MMTNIHLIFNVIYLIIKETWHLLYVIFLVVINTIHTSLSIA